MPFDETSPHLTRREVLTGAAAVAALAATSEAASAHDASTAFSEPPAAASDLELWYDHPAEAWVEALPVGNGRSGAMIFGGVAEERLQLNESTLWAGGPHDYTNPQAREALDEIRRLVFAGEYVAATRLADAKFMSRPIGQAPYQTLGDLRITQSGGKSEAYRRSLDLDRAVHHCSYVQDGVKFERECFASHPANVIVVRFAANRKGAISLRARLTTPHDHALSAGDAKEFRLEGRSGDFAGISGAVRFCAVVRPRVMGGQVRFEAGEWVVDRADEVVLVLALATSYRRYDDVSADPVALAHQTLLESDRKSFASLLADHVADHQSLFRNVSLRLGSEAPSRAPTDARLDEYQVGRDVSLPALYFQYGRYLQIASSRRGGQPANLQGLWNDSLTPPWGSKFTTNINTEMNYWPTETCGLSECHEPLFAMIRDLTVTGAHTAKVHYGARGWVLHHNTDGWRGAAPIDGASWGIWPTGGAWLCTHLWERFRFTQDKARLREHYPWIKAATEFFLDTMQPRPGDGLLVTNPSTSPENRHPKGSGLCAGPTMDLFIVRDLFEACIESAKALDVDAEFRAEVARVREKIAPPKIGAHEQLQEWMEDWDAAAPEIHHRHVSHLYGLFPSHQITAEGTAEMFAAVKRSLEMRGDEGTGWSLAWKLNLWARLREGDHAVKLIKDALRPVRSLKTNMSGGGGVYPNLFDAHPPFQIDGNFGFTSGVAEMLVQSHAGEIHLLPALPTAWKDGAVSGIRARGGHVVAVEWKSERAFTAKIRSHAVGSLKLRFGTSVKSFPVSPGKELIVSSADFA